MARSPSATPQEEATDATACRRCGAALAEQALYRQFAVCAVCQWHAPISARRRIEQLVDPDSFRETHRWLATTDPLGFSDRLPYPERLAQARSSADSEESVITGVGAINGIKTVLVVSEFGFLGGSMGAVMGEKVALACEEAISRRLPLIAITASGGARMQEGMLSLVQMATTASAVTRLKAAGLPMISVLTSPTTGGVYASFASLADITLAEPEALIGFAGPRVFETMTGSPPPEGAQTAEFLLEHGWIDAIVDRPRLRSKLATLLQLLHRPDKRKPHCKTVLNTLPQSPDRDPWGTVQLARRPDRPTASLYIQKLLPQFVELRGDRASGDDPAVVCGIGDFAGTTVAVIGLERGTDADRDLRRDGRASAAGYRKALRMMRLAAQLDLPLVTFVDTPGAWLDAETDARGLAPSIAACLAEMSSLPVPTIAAVIGEGGSGGALALGVADRVLMQENAIYSVIGPEGAAAILFRDAARAPDVANALKLTAADCQTFGVIDAIVPEPDGGASVDPNYAALLLQNSMRDALAELHAMGQSKRIKQRNQKFRRMGQRTIQSRQPRPFVRELQRLPHHIRSVAPRMLESLFTRSKPATSLGEGVIHG